MKPVVTDATLAMRSGVDDGATRKTVSIPAASVAAIHEPASSGMRSGVMTPQPPALARSVANALDAVALDRVPVGHDQAGSPRARHALDGAEDVDGLGAVGQRDLGGCLDRRAVHERIAVGEADLDDVDAGLDHRLHHGDTAPRPWGNPAGR